MAVACRVTPGLPALLALSASTPYWLGADTGYASYRTLIWRRWAIAGSLHEFESAADYDRAMTDLIRSGVITDPGMIYLDVWPSTHLPTLELRICDSCPRLEDVVLLAGLFRALVISRTAAATRPPAGARPSRAAPGRDMAGGSSWSGGNLVDPVTAAPCLPAGSSGSCWPTCGLRWSRPANGSSCASSPGRPLPGAAQRHGSAPRGEAGGFAPSSIRWSPKPGPPDHGCGAPGGRCANWCLKTSAGGGDNGVPWLAEPKMFAQATA